MTENCIPVDCLEEVKEQHARLRVLVRELLLKNQELRDQLATTLHSLQELHPPALRQFSRRLLTGAQLGDFASSSRQYGPL